MRRYNNSVIAGIDEVGRGCIAGPVVAACVILNLNCIPDGLNDSKKISEKNRIKLSNKIKKTALAWSIAYCDASEIDAINILEATMLAMRRSILASNIFPSFILVDGNRLPSLIFNDIIIEGDAIVKGDEKVPQISAASIIAKVYRDKMMENFDKIYDGYLFSEHKGYGTKKHIDIISSLGPSPQHRLTFKPFSS